MFNNFTSIAASAWNFIPSVPNVRDKLNLKNFTNIATSSRRIIHYRPKVGDKLNYFASLRMKKYIFSLDPSSLVMEAWMTAINMKTWSPIIGVNDLSKALGVPDRNIYYELRSCKWFSDYCSSYLGASVRCLERNCTSEKEAFASTFKGYLDSLEPRYNSTYTNERVVIVAIGVFILGCVALRIKCRATGYARRDDIVDAINEV